MIILWHCSATFASWGAKEPNFWKKWVSALLWTFLWSKSPKRRAEGGPKGANQGEMFRGLLKNVKPFWHTSYVRVTHLHKIGPKLSFLHFGSKIPNILMLSKIWKTHLHKIGPKLRFLHFGSEIPNILMLSKFLKYPFAQNWSQIEIPTFWIQNQVKITISTNIHR